MAWCSSWHPNTGILQLDARPCSQGAAEGGEKEMAANRERLDIDRRLLEAKPAALKTEPAWSEATNQQLRDFRERLEEIVKEEL